MMTPISQMVHNTLNSGYLTTEAEATLCQLFEDSYNLKDIAALTVLQHAMLSGRVKRQSQQNELAYSI